MVAGADASLFPTARAVINVTTLADSGAGSLRAALAKTGSRDIRFTVSGVIRPLTRLVVNPGDVRIQGETSPLGITIKGQTIEIKRALVKISHIAFRAGAAPAGQADNWDGFAITGSLDSSRDMGHIIIDHCSMIGGTDEVFQLWGTRIHNLTISNSIIAEGLNNAGHSKGAHSMGLLVGTDVENVLIYRTLFMSNNWRNPVLHGNSSTALINNLIYNPGKQALHVYDTTDAPGPTLISAVKNRVIAGPNTPPYMRMCNDSYSANVGSQIYLDGNVTEGATATWNYAEVANLARVYTPPVAWPAGLDICDADDLEALIATNVGPMRRDATDLRLLAELAARTGSIKNSPVE